METLWRVVASMQAAAAAAGRHDRHRRHQGRRPRQGRRPLHQHRRHRRRASTARRSAPTRVRPGDAVILSAATSAGTAWRSWRCARGCSSRARIESDCAPLARAGARRCFDGGHRRPLPARPDARRPGQRARRDRRSGPAARSTSTRTAIPVREDVRGACEILGFDPLYVANEGRFVALRPAGRRRAGARRAARRSRSAGSGRDRGGRIGLRPGARSCAAGSAPPASSTCSAGSSCRASAETTPLRSRRSPRLRRPAMWLPAENVTLTAT